ncbi:MAG: zeta toxin family protein [Edaphobacter sp.]|uniref:AAA family ATPase n=1 Tax=Edaphobacter sp. TaxID=1934404 RepID=UPI00239EC13A|nr:zeta toxin family protein [Edaphobacter sp.]MDE1178555.1 zeta toxin family protein [Edaphobacter sp.]
MAGSLLILTGASGAGKTTLAHAIEAASPSCVVLFFDSIGVPSPEGMAAYTSGYGNGPEGWQRSMTFEWMRRIAPVLESGQSVLFEGQMRIAFLDEAMAAAGIRHARIVLVDCDDQIRSTRLTQDRQQPELAHEGMMSWARYLRDEAKRSGHEILDTGSVPFAVCAQRLIAHLD